MAQQCNNFTKMLFSDAIWSWTRWCDYVTIHMYLKCISNLILLLISEECKSTFSHAYDLSTFIYASFVTEI